jgi:DNA polymerase/3'-5' exonuclease PolX
MQQIYENTGDRKQYAYLRAIAAIRNYGREIKNAEELKNIEGLGRKTIDKIREFLKTGSITKVEQRLSAKNSVPHKELLRVHGIGLNTAEGLAHKGIKTL